MGILQRIVLFLLYFAISGCSSYSSMKRSAEAEDFLYSYEQSFEKREELPTGSLFSQSSSFLASGDRRASGVGDILTVVLTETTQSTTQSKSSVSRDGSHTLGLPTPLSNVLGKGGLLSSVLADNAISAKHKYDGSGVSEQSNKMTGSVSSVITRIFPNGNFYISGIKQVTTNGGEDYVRLTGIIRPHDINSNNTIESKRIANAKIAFVSGGDVSDASKQGWLGRFFTVVDPF
jgi:flagellar L-ring protein precursor FlgH